MTALDPTPPHLRIELFGPLRVHVDGHPVQRWPRRDARDLLLLLAAHVEHRLTRDRIVQCLWPEAAHPQQRLADAAYALRKVIDPQRASHVGAGRLRLQGAEFVLATGEGVSIDTDEFERLLEVGLLNPEATEALVRACALYRGPLAEGEAPHPWLEPERRQLAARQSVALWTLAQRLQQAGDAAAAIDALTRLVNHQPDHEQAHRELMRAHLVAGRADLALAQFDRCREALAEAGRRPEAATLALRDAAAAKPVPAPQVRPLPRFQAPARLGPPLIERAALTEQCRRVLGAPAGGRLLTLCGPGGVGKTQFALHLAALVAPGFEHGVCVVEMAPLVRAEDVLFAAARALGLRDLPAADAPAALARHIGGARLLLVLDNFEHVVDAAPAVAALLAEAPQLRLLCTSRVPLHVAEEQVVRVPTLGLPPPQAAHAVVVAATPAAQLFLQRAAAVDPAFVLDDGNAGALAELCHRLDGLPLALELAAARVRVFGLHGLALRLQQGHELLQSNQRGAPERHRSLQAVLDWTHQLLPADAQRLFAALSLCGGSFDADAAEGMLGLGAARSATALEALIEHCLVVGAPAAGALPRHRLYETVRTFARERLESQADAGVRQHALQYWAGLANRINLLRRESSAGAAEALALFESEIANFESTLAACAQADLEIGHEMLSDLSWFWLSTGRHAQAMANAARVVDLAGSHATGARMRAAVWTHTFAMLTGDQAFMQRCFEAVRESPHLRDDPYRHTDLYLARARCLSQNGQYEAAVETGARALVIARESGLMAVFGVTSAVHSVRLINAGRYAQARAVLDEAQAHLHEMPPGEASSVMNSLAGLESALGNVDAAFAAAERSLVLARQANNLNKVFFACAEMSSHRLQACRLEEGLHWLQEARAANARLGDAGLPGLFGHLEADSLCLQRRWAEAAAVAENAARLCSRPGELEHRGNYLLIAVRARLAFDPPSARDTFEQVLALRDRMQHCQLGGLLSMAALVAMRFSPAGAAELAAHARAFRQRHGIVQTPLEQDVSHPLETLPPRPLPPAPPAAEERATLFAAIDAVFAPAARLRA